MGNSISGQENQKETGIILITKHKDKGLFILIPTKKIQPYRL